MDALDALPLSIRRALMFSPVRHSPAAVLKALRNPMICECMVIEAIELKNAEMCAAYRAAMAAGKL